MNCKPGDLAIGVAADPEKAHNIGVVVRVVRKHEFLTTHWHVVAMSAFISRGIQFPAGTHAIADDKYMRPIRDNDGEDEILRIAGKPVKEVA